MRRPKKFWNRQHFSFCFRSRISSFNFGPTNQLWNGLFRAARAAQYFCRSDRVAKTPESIRNQGVVQLPGVHGGVQHRNRVLTRTAIDKRTLGSRIGEKRMRRQFRLCAIQKTLNALLSIADYVAILLVFCYSLCVVGY
jgi:hypothetical protein